MNLMNSSVQVVDFQKPRKFDFIFKQFNKAASGNKLKHRNLLRQRQYAPITLTGRPPSAMS
jgi:hypothetical protein